MCAPLKRPIIAPLWWPLSRRNAVAGGRPPSYSGAMDMLVEIEAEALLPGDDAN
jgi:hypothetical protein